STRDLRSYQRGAVLEILRTLRRPDLKLRVMCPQRVEMPLASPRVSQVDNRRVGKRTIKMVFGRLSICCGIDRRRSPGFQRGLDGARIVPCMEARLKFRDPVIDFDGYRLPRACQLPLERRLIKFAVVKGSEFGGQATQVPDQS